jgi:tetratricopeptide (TPR) repeat protein
MPVDGIQAPGTGPRGRGWRLFVAWVIVPPVLLCLVELGLRLGGLGVSTQLFLPREVRGETVCMPNRAFFQQFYTLPIGGPPHEFCMPAAKPPNTYRVFVFGSSAAEGVPAADFSFWRILWTMLRARQHGEKTEIYSVALAGANSHVMRAAAKACAAYQPDLFLVYMGNNELNPSVTQAMVWDRLPPWLALRLLHLSIALNDLRLVQLLHGITGPNDLDRPHGDAESVRAPERAYEYYRANVNDMCAFAKEAGARVILCTVGSRLREWLPEGVRAPALDSAAGQQWNDDYEAGNKLRGRESFEDALAAYTRAAAVYSDHAGLAYGIACCHYALGNYADARPWFVRARELDERHCRAGNRINDVLREIAAARAGDGVHLADTVQSLADASPHGIEGPELFLDYVHLSFEGNCVLARTVLESLASVEPRLADQGSPPSVEECRLRLALTPPDLRDQLEAAVKANGFKGGVQSKSRLERDMAELDAQIGARAKELRLEGCRKALQTDPQNELVRARHVRLLADKGDKVGALEQAKILVADFPYSWQGHLLLAQLFTTLGDNWSAIDMIRLVLAWRPEDANAYARLGQLLLQENQPETALAAFRTSLRLKPCAETHCGIARVFLKQGNSAKAVKAFRRSLELEPGDPAVFEDLIIALCDANRLTEAKREMEHWRAVAGGQGSPHSNTSVKIGQRQNPPGHPTEDGGVETRMSVLRQLWRTLPDNPNSASRFQRRFMDEAVRLEAAGDLTGAVMAYREAIPLDALNDEPVLRLDKVLSTSNAINRRAVWEGVLKDNPGNVRVAALCTVARTAAGDIAGAKQLFPALPENLLSPSAFQGLCLKEAERLEAAGDMPGAINACREAIPLDPQNDQPLQRLEKALSESSPADRRAVWENLLRENPGNPNVAARCGIARAGAGDLAGAKQLFQTLPNNSNLACTCQTAMTDEGGRLEGTGNLPGAAKAYQEAIPLNPKNGQPVQLLEKVLAKRDPADRRAVWEDLLRENPGNPNVAVYCGIARAAAGETAGAKSAFDIATRLAPDEWHYYELAADALAAAGAWDDAVAAYAGALARNPKLDYLLIRLDAAESCSREGLQLQATDTHPPPAQ